jgi:hypothetical protein
MYIKADLTEEKLRRTPRIMIRFSETAEFSVCFRRTSEGDTMFLHFNLSTQIENIFM